ncbi:uncharacterized protein C8R40DRAFT_1070888 [Lentinula edodes]|uniref:uncharacterized protein n=1 Tax=Lentinula edodes TaxID=5353 RepID=UPI001E8CA57B|nr:uncharacterized protein C8R40DRAFT_1070888 [Lentinula edodes]KAH7873694.1 hypothetical protein C8R40DRAFT_1070888 [Lentinula edodes]
MAQVILNRDSLDFTPLDSSILETVVATAQTTIDSTFSQSDNDSALADVFKDPRLRHRSVIDASIRIQSLQRDMRNHLSALQGLSSESEPTVIQNVVGRAERAVQATSSDLRKGAKRDAVQLEVSEANAVLDEVRKLVLSWRESYPDNSPLRVDNGTS